MTAYNTAYILADADYSVCGLGGYTLSQALQHWKSKFDTIKHFRRDVITHPGLQSLGDFVQEVWEDIIPLTVQEALSESNMERRRVMFDCIGVAQLFRSLEPALLDRQVITKQRTRWHDDYTPYEVVYDDTYELYEIPSAKLFANVGSHLRETDVYAVRCWCTTTAREYWIYVPKEVAVGTSYQKLEPDAIRAIAWTIRIDISNPKRIFRQGDIIVVEESPDSQPVADYHLTREQYLSLLFSET